MRRVTVQADRLTLPCSTDPDAWHSTRRPDQLEAAEACFRCPIRVECRAGADERSERSGVWGGKIYGPQSTIGTCKQGHLMTPENRRPGNRGCKTCNREGQRKRRAGIPGRPNLTMDQARQIRRLATSGTTHDALALRYGVQRQAIQRILRGKTHRERVSS